MQFPLRTSQKKEQRKQPSFPSQPPSCHPHLCELPRLLATHSFSPLRDNAHVVLQNYFLSSQPRRRGKKLYSQQEVITVQEHKNLINNPSYGHLNPRLSQQFPRQLVSKFQLAFSPKRHFLSVLFFGSLYDYSFLKFLQGDPKHGCTIFQEPYSL